MVVGLAIFGAVAAMIGIVVAIYLSDESPFWLTQAVHRILRVKSKELPAYSQEAERSRQRLRDQIGEFLSQEESLSRKLKVPMAGDLLTSETPAPHGMIDCICSLLAHNGRVILVLNSGDQALGFEGIGRTSLITRLLGMHLPHTELMAICSQRLARLSDVSLDASPPGDWNLISSDMAYIGLIDGQLCASPIQGERPSFLWDLARHLFRTTDLSYQPGDHRDNPEKRKLLIDLFMKLRPGRWEELYASGHESILPIEGIIILQRERAACFSISSSSSTGQSRSAKLIRESMLVSTDQHESAFWKRSTAATSRYLKWLIAGADQLPETRVITIGAPSGDVPGFIYDIAVKSLNVGYTPSIERLGTVDSSSILMGVDSFHAALFQSLPLVNNVRILVTSGEKLFRDGSFWRRFVNSDSPCLLEILLLDPHSPSLPEIERTSYPEKTAGFLRQEIQDSLDAIRNVVRYSADSESSVKVQCWVYSDRPLLRCAILDNSRALVSHYFPNMRTGDDTLFLDVHDKEESEFLSGIRDLFDEIKQRAHPIDL